MDDFEKKLSEIHERVLGKAHFAIKTRQQELIDNFEELNDDQKDISCIQHRYILIFRFFFFYILYRALYFKLITLKCQYFFQKSVDFFAHEY